MQNTLKCKDCKQRHLGCHSTCSSYQKYKEEREKIKEASRVNNCYTEYLFDRLAKEKR